MLALPLFLALLSAAPADPAAPKDSPRVVVGVDRLDVYGEVDDQGFITSRLPRDTEVTIRQQLANGWLAIAPPRGEFLWVDASTVEELRDGRLFVSSQSTALRLGRADFQQLGPLKTTVLESTVLLPVAGVPPIETRKGRVQHTWRAVKLGPDDVRFIRTAGVFNPGLSDAVAPVKKPVPERTVAFVPAELPAEVAVPLKAIDERHRAAVTRPVGEWDLSAVKRDYQSLLLALNDSPAAKPVRDRLEDVAHEDELAKAANDFETLIKKSRKRDVEVTKVKEAIRSLRETEELAFDAEGLLQASSRQVSGERVFSLLDDNGQIIAYLKVPPGIDTHNLVARWVGVRGKSRFNDTLRYRLLDVRDMEPLDQGR